MVVDCAVLRASAARLMWLAIIVCLTDAGLREVRDVSSLSVKWGHPSQG